MLADTLLQAAAIFAAVCLVVLAAAVLADWLYARADRRRWRDSQRIRGLAESDWPREDLRR